MIPVSKIKNWKFFLKRNEKKMLLDAMPNAFVFVAWSLYLKFKKI